MANFNKVILLGNLTRDPELKYTQGGQAIAKFGLAVSRKYTQNGETKEQVCFVDITAWGRTAEIVNEYAKKGKPILVEGRLDYQTWEKDGQKRSKHEVVAENIQLLGARDGAGSGGGGGGESRRGGAAGGGEAAAGGEADFDSIPF
ncbi:MAG: single-stranded DNA-binding protein [Planctomycetes bacterium]|nr:single-stranded DNA-binding protein [Planctomycetota bacterium]